MFVHAATHCGRRPAKSHQNRSVFNATVKRCYLDKLNLYIYITVALFHEDDDSINRLAYDVSARTVNVLNTILPNNKILQKSEYIVNDMYNVTRVGKQKQISHFHQFYSRPLTNFTSTDKYINQNLIFYSEFFTVKSQNFTIKVLKTVRILPL